MKVRGARRFREQKWLLDSVVSTIGLDWDLLSGRLDLLRHRAMADRRNQLHIGFGLQRHIHDLGENAPSASSARSSDRGSVATFSHKVSSPLSISAAGHAEQQHAMLADSTRIRINLTAVNERVNVSTYA
jgi:hypothetical protein